MERQGGVNMEEKRECAESEEWDEPAAQAAEEEEEWDEPEPWSEEELISGWMLLEEQKRYFRDKADRFMAEQETAEREMERQRRRLRDEERKLQESERFFEQKMDILKGGFAQLEADRREVEKNRMRLEAEIDTMKTASASKEECVRLFFTGADNLLTLKKRYKDLIKIFHPDNLCGDTELLQKINEVYETLREEVEWQKKA